MQAAEALLRTRMASLGLDGRKVARVRKLARRQRWRAEHPQERGTRIQQGPPSWLHGRAVLQDSGSTGPEPGSPTLLCGFGDYHSATLGGGQGALYLGPSRPTSTSGSVAWRAFPNGAEKRPDARGSPASAPCRPRRPVCAHATKGTSAGRLRRSSPASRAHSKPGPGSRLRPGATCSWPVTSANG